MCGFITGNIFTDEKQFRTALSLIDHRGKDSKGVNYSIQTDTWLGHNRLSIQGLTQSADQPMFKWPYILVYNGELWHSMNPYKSKFDLQTGSLSLIHI